MLRLRPGICGFLWSLAVDSTTEEMKFFEPVENHAMEKPRWQKRAR